MKEINMLNDQLNELALDTKKNSSQLQIQFRQLMNDNLTQSLHELLTVKSEVRYMNDTLHTEILSANNQFNTWISNPYRNCYQEIRSFPLNRLINNNKRLCCTTAYLQVNRTVSHKIKNFTHCINIALQLQNYYTLDMRCEYSSGAQLEAATLQYSSSNSVYCQCSIL